MTATPLRHKPLIVDGVPIAQVPTRTMAFYALRERGYTKRRTEELMRHCTEGPDDFTITAPPDPE